MVGFMTRVILECLRSCTGWHVCDVWMLRFYYVGPGLLVSNSSWI